MSTQFKEHIFWTIRNNYIAELKAQGSNLTSLDLDIIYRAMEAHKRVALLKRGADPVDGSHIPIDMPDENIQYVIDNPYAQKYPFTTNQVENADIANTGRLPEQTGSSKKAKGTDK